MERASPDAFLADNSLQSLFGEIRPGFIHSRYNRTKERTTGAERTGNVDCKHICGPPVELVFRQGQLTQFQAHPGRIERNVALADYPPVCRKADCLPKRASAKLRRQPDDVHPVADDEELDVPSLVAMMAHTTLQREFESVSGPDHAQVMRRWVLAETDVEAVDVAVDVVFAGADDEE